MEMIARPKYQELPPRDPVLVVILTISEQSNDYLEIVNDYLRQHNKTFVFMGGGDAVGVLVR